MGDKFLTGLAALLASHANNQTCNSTGSGCATTHGASTPIPSELLSDTEYKLQSGSGTVIPKTEQQKTSGSFSILVPTLASQNVGTTPKDTLAGQDPATTTLPEHDL